MAVKIGIGLCESNSLTFNSHRQILRYFFSSWMTTPSLPPLAMFFGHISWFDRHLYRWMLTADYTDRSPPSPSTPSRGGEGVSLMLARAGISASPSFLGPTKEIIRRGLKGEEAISSTVADWWRLSNGHSKDHSSSHLFPFFRCRRRRRRSRIKLAKSYDDKSCLSFILYWRINGRIKG